MLTRLGRVVLLWMLCLLSFATCASAECAWVLWFYRAEERVDGGLRGSDSIDSAYPTLAECDRELAATREVLKGEGYKVSGGTARGSHIVIGNKEGERVKYSCLPETVDPRGPKGK
jgi:hypothetical protein